MNTPKRSPNESALTTIVGLRLSGTFPAAKEGDGEKYREDVPGAEVHILNAGHFALDE